MVRPLVRLTLLLALAACGASPSAPEAALDAPAAGQRDGTGGADTTIHTTPGDPTPPAPPTPEPEPAPSHPAADAPVLEQVDLVLTPAGGSVDVALVNRRGGGITHRDLGCSVSWQRKDGDTWRYVGEPVACPGDLRVLAAGATTTQRVAAPTTAGTWRAVTVVGDAEALISYAVWPITRSAAFVVP